MYKSSILSPQYYYFNLKIHRFLLVSGKVTKKILNIKTWEYNLYIVVTLK